MHVSRFIVRSAALNYNIPEQTSTSSPSSSQVYSSGILLCVCTFEQSGRILICLHISTRLRHDYELHKAYIYVIYNIRRIRMTHRICILGQSTRLTTATATTANISHNSHGRQNVRNTLFVRLANSPIERNAARTSI